ncbi:MAG: ATP phosphoribosyltransferase regulatory subunit [Alphaproteobacteria bacterium]
MNDLPHKALLPAGFHDVLPPDAGHEAAVVERLMAVLASHGYARVKPPLVEFEETLLGGVGTAMAKETFRLMDPISQRMMAVRADMTLQIARIADSRLGSAPRPLRLGYAGQVLRVKGSQLRPERQFAQVGAELIGTAEPAADVEVAALAATALRAVGAANLSIDLKSPVLVTALLDEMPPPADRAAPLRHALDRKDAAMVGEIGGAAAPPLAALMAATGRAVDALPALERLKLPGAAAAERDRLVEVARLVADAAPDLVVTVDPVEHRGFEYHIGVSFTLFARGVRGELGRGGRYRTGTGGSPATGVTLFMDSVLRALPPPATPDRLYLPFGTARGDADRWRGDGWVTVAGLAPAADAAAEARRLGCSHVLADGAVRPV